MQHFWIIFRELHTARGSNGFGVNPISYAEIDAWARLTATPLGAFDVGVLRRIDLAYLTADADRADTERTTKPKK